MPTMIDAENKYMVSAYGVGVSILNLPWRSVMTPDDALNLAAWLVAMTEAHASNDFESVLRAVVSS